MNAISDGALRFVASPPAHLGRFRAAVSERTGGASAHPFASLNVGRSTADDPGQVRENEQIILRSLGLRDRVARLRLEHGARLVRPDGPGMFGPADALLSGDPALVLWFTVADCVAVTITAGEWRAHGHCGWRSIAAGLLEEMVAALAESEGTPPAGQRAWVGPGVGPCCYEVGPEVAVQFNPAALRVAPAGRGGEGNGEGGSFLDLRVEITLRLARLGLPAPAVAVSRACTRCEADRFFSHRRDGVPTGRMAALSYDDPAAVRTPDSATGTSSR